MDEDQLISQLKCDIELELEGPNDKTVNKWTADALRKLAERIEGEGFEDGFHPVKDSVGKPVGTIYIDCTGERA